MWKSLLLGIFSMLVKGYVDCNGEYACPDNTTCCWNGSGWGCCNLKNAVCCIDGIRCVFF